jgi:uncharacterized protein (UPF0276 family)
MTKLSQALSSFPAVTRASQTVWSFLRRGLSAPDATPALMEWDNDVPPFPIFTGEVIHAEASLPLPTRRHRRHLAA